MMNAMQMPMNNAMPMMGMPMMMATMQCEMTGDAMMCTLKPAAGMDMAMFKNNAEMMAMMLNCGMPMMMQCANLSMMCMSEDAMAMMSSMSMPMMMPMGMPMPMMKCVMECKMEADGMTCKMMPMPGMSMDMMNNCCMLMMKMMNDCAMPMMMSCNGMPMMCCTC